MKTKHVRLKVISSDFTQTPTQGEMLYIQGTLTDGRTEQYVATGNIARLVDNWIRPSLTIMLEVQEGTSIIRGVRLP